MATMTKTRRSVKTNRLLRVSEPVNGVRAVALTDARGMKCGYYLSGIGSDWGRAFRFEKFEHEVQEGTDSRYDVHLDDELGDSCTCPGHIYKGKCKHVDAVKVLIARGVIK